LNVHWKKGMNMRSSRLLLLAGLCLLVTQRQAPAAPAPGLPPTVAPGEQIRAVYDESQGEKRFFEGPSYDPHTDTLYFTAFGKERSQVLKLDSSGQASVFLDNSEGLNGTFLSRKRFLLGCQGDKGRVVRIPLDQKGAAQVEVVADNFDGKPLGNPNDLAEDARGGIYFTCPDFKEKNNDKKTSAVYYVNPEGKVHKLIEDMVVPNGVYVAKGGLAIYVSDSERKNVWAYEVDPVTGLRPVRDRKTVEGRMFFDAGLESENPPDGMTMDEHGNAYFTGRGGISCVGPNGKTSLGFIPVPEFCSNCTFGGKDGRTLYITCQNKVYRIGMQVRGWEAASRHEMPADPPLRFKQVTLDKTFRSEGIAIADVNKDGKNDLLAGDVWYEAPSWTMHEIREPKKYNGLTGYSRSFLTWAEDWTGDGYVDYLVIPFPGQNGYWYENPKGKPERWKEHDLWHSCCNETPIYADLLGNGKKQLVMAWQPPGKSNDGIMGYLNPPPSGQGKWEAHPISGEKAPGTFNFSHGLGVGDVNGDGRNDVITTDGWYEQPEKGSAAAMWTFHKAPFSNLAADMYAYDLTGDGLADVIASSAHNYGIWWYEQVRAGGGESEWRQHLIDTSFSQSHSLSLVDMNGDGVKDLVTGKRWYAHQGHDPGEFEPVVLYWFEVRRGTPPRFIPHLMDLGTGIGTQFVVGDVNGDKLLDIAVSNKRGVYLLEQIGRPN
jgi:sugar lactone lactonase YvrE